MRKKIPSISHHYIAEYYVPTPIHEVWVMFTQRSCRSSHTASDQKLDRGKPGNKANSGDFERKGMTITGFDLTSQS